LLAMLQITRDQIMLELERLQGPTTNQGPDPLPEVGRIA
jgi:hypothetical protein